MADTETGSGNGGHIQSNNIVTPINYLKSPLPVGEILFHISSDYQYLI